MELGCGCHRKQDGVDIRLFKTLLDNAVVALRSKTLMSLGKALQIQQADGEKAWGWVLDGRYSTIQYLRIPCQNEGKRGRFSRVISREGTAGDGQLRQ
jgi:hypothetical protein